MKIIVLVKQLPDTDEERKLSPVFGRGIRWPGENGAQHLNEQALEVALRYKDLDKKTEVVVLSMGPESATYRLRRAHSLGADAVLHILDDSMVASDIGRTAATLSLALKWLRTTGFDLVVFSSESTNEGCGNVPALVAEHLALPLLASLDMVDISEGWVLGKRRGDSGSLAVRAAMPAVISVTERSGDPRVPKPLGVMMARRKPLTTVTLRELSRIQW